MNTASHPAWGFAGFRHRPATLQYPGGTDPSRILPASLWNGANRPDFRPADPDGGRKVEGSPAVDRVGPWLPPTPSFWVRTVVLAVLWYFTSTVAGYFIADPITHSYYAAKMTDLPSINAWLPVLQWIRGVLWTLLFVLAVRLMNRPLGEAGLVAGLLFGVFHAAGLLLPSTFMPNNMRLSHLPEIVLSLVWQGSLTVAVLGCRKARKR